MPRSFVSSVTEPEGGVTHFDFGIATAGDLDGVEELTTTVADRRGEVTTYTLDRYGSPLAVEDPLGVRTTMTWAADDVLMIGRTDGKGTTTSYTYDQYGNLLTEAVEVEDYDGAAHVYTAANTYALPGAFDPPFIKDRRVSATDRNGHVTTFEYDAHGGLVRQAVTDTDSETVHTYFANGDRASTTDGRGDAVHFTYDPYGNLASATDPLGGVAATEWNGRSLPVRQVDRLGRETRLAYDTLGRAIAKTLPKTAAETAAPVETVLFDDAERRRVATDAAGRTTETLFDLEGRPVEVHDPEGGTKVFAYDAEGNKTVESAWFDAATSRVDTTFDYDAAGRLIRRTEPLGRVTDYAYDGAGNLVSETLSDAGGGFAPRVTEHDYDSLDRRIRTRRIFAGGTQTRSVRYDGVGNKVEEVEPLGRVTTYNHDPLNRLTEQVEPEWKPGSPRVTRIAYDPVGNVLSKTLVNEPAEQVRSFVYDALSRVVQATDAEGAKTLSEYDAEGNKTRQIDPRLAVTTFEYDARNRPVRTIVHLDRVTQPSRQVATEYEYDAVGNRTVERWANGNVVQHAYDGLNRLTSTTDSLGPIATFGYDSRGNRVRARPTPTATSPKPTSTPSTGSSSSACPRSGR